MNTVLEAGKANPDSTLSFVSRAKEGDQEAFAELFDLHKKRVYSLCWRMTGNHMEAEDLTQDAFMQVFRKLDTFRGDSSFSTWLYRVAVNTVLMQIRRRVPKQVSMDEPIEMESSFMSRDIGRHDLRLTGSVDRITLGRAIAELPAGCRQIFILHQIEGYEHHEIAEMLRCSVGNSKSQLHKARMKLRDSLLKPAQAFYPKAVNQQYPENEMNKDDREKGASLTGLRRIAS